MYHREEGQAQCLVLVRRPIVHLIPRRARIHGSQTCVSLNSRLESNKKEEEETWETLTDFLYHEFLIQGYLAHEKHSPFRTTISP